MTTADLKAAAIISLLVRLQCLQHGAAELAEREVVKLIEEWERRVKDEEAA